MALLTSTKELEKIARNLRIRLVEMSCAARTPHLGSALSCIDILVSAYWTYLQIDPAQATALDRDRFILSKGHAATALYVTLAERGFFPKTHLDNFATLDSPLAEHPSPGCVPGVELATGSLGHGLPVGLGMALASKIQGLTYRVVVTLSDGECNEGSVWEAALFAPQQRLENLMAIIDYNKWQATGRSNQIMALESLRDKWTAFGWRTLEVDGHNIAELSQAMRTAPQSQRPTAIIAHTIKGKGVSFMEDDNNWHYRIPTLEDVELARKELL
jgi:transketolase